MPDPPAFSEYLRRIRAGEPVAIEEFVARFAPYIRRSVRARLSQLGLRAAADSHDLCQSVLGSFLLRAAAGEYDLNDADALQRLLLTMARNKLAALARRENAQRRDRRRIEDGIDLDELPAGSRSDPGSQVAARDLLAEVRARLTADELELFQARQNGESWEAIAARCDMAEATLRQRLSRALRRVAVQLRLEDDDEQPRSQ